MMHALLMILAAGTPTTATPEPVTPPAFAAEAALGVNDLEQATAREDIAQTAIANQSARVSNNSVNGQSTTGTVAIDGNAFQNLSGLAIVNVNTGNNVAINAALNVNLTFSPVQP